MAYNSSKGPQQHGDVQFEDDPEDTQIDFENDFIALKTNGIQRFIINGSHITASVSLSSSAAADFKSLNINGARATISDAGAFTATSLTASQGIRANEFSAAGHMQAPVLIAAGGAGIISGSGQGSFDSINIGGGRASVSNVGVITAVSLTASAAGHFQSLQINGNRALIDATGAITARELTASAGIKATSVSGSGAGAFQTLAINGNRASIDANGALNVREITASAGIKAVAVSGSGAGSFQSLAINGGVASISNAGGAVFGAVTVTSVTSSGAGGFQSLTINGNHASIDANGKTILRELTASSGILAVSVSASAAGAFQTLAINGNRASIDANGALSVREITASAGIKAVTVSGSGAGTFQSLSIHGGVASISNAGAAVLGAVTATSVTSSGAGGFQSLAVNGNRASINALGAATFREITSSAGIKTTTISGSGLASFQLLNINNNAMTVAADGAIGVNEEPGIGCCFKIKAPADESAMIFKFPSHEVVLGITGSGKVTVGGLHLVAKLNVTGSDLDTLFEAKSNTRNPAFRVAGHGETFISGSLILKNTEPTIYFSSSHSPGTPLGQIGYNSSDNILIQNDTINKHIVFKVNDGGTTREGFRINGSVPEVVVNEGSDSLVDFRVESNNKTHMLFVDGSTDKVGINTATPGDSLSVVGSTHMSGSVRFHTALKVANYSLGVSDRVVVFNPTNGVTASLPALSDTNVGITYTIKNISPHMIQVSASSAQEDFIDGLTTHDLPPGGPGSGSFVTVCGYAIGAGFDWAVIAKN